MRVRDQRGLVHIVDSKPHKNERGAEVSGRFRCGKLWLWSTYELRGNDREVFASCEHAGDAAPTCFHCVL